jgi:hypothetical protein
MNMNKYYKMFSMALVSLFLACSSGVATPTPDAGSIEVVSDVSSQSTDSVSLPGDVTVVDDIVVPNDVVALADDATGTDTASQG